MPAPEETIRITAHTEPGTFQFGYDQATGEPLGYSYDKVVALTHSEGDERRHTGRADIESMETQDLVLPREIGYRLLELMESAQEGNFNCHAFARTATGELRASHPISLLHPSQRTEELSAGEVGQIGSLERFNGEPEHSVVGVGNGRSIEVGGQYQPIGIAHTSNVVDYYRRLRPGSDVGLYRPLPPGEVSPDTPPSIPQGQVSTGGLRRILTAVKSRFSSRS